MLLLTLVKGCTEKELYWAETVVQKDKQKKVYESLYICVCVCVCVHVHINFTDFLKRYLLFGITTSSDILMKERMLFCCLSPNRKCYV